MRFVEKAEKTGNKIHLSKVNHFCYFSFQVNPLNNIFNRPDQIAEIPCCGCV